MTPAAQRAERDAVRSYRRRPVVRIRKDPVMSAFPWRVWERDGEAWTFRDGAKTHEYALQVADEVIAYRRRVAVDALSNDAQIVHF